ncbi:hypothetical protein [Chromobacterium haemolyticum]|uniref:hypothetical protein n=1 Tax=Chromobacterium TaxID=535 RepID=UPI0040577C45
MKKALLLIAAMALAVPAVSFAGKHGGGHYSGGKGSSHKGGHYKNKSTNDHYRKRH